MSNTYFHEYSGFEPTDKIILIYFQGRGLDLKTSALFLCQSLEITVGFLFYTERIVI